MASVVIVEAHKPDKQDVIELIRALTDHGTIWLRTPEQVYYGDGGTLEMTFRGVGQPTARRMVQDALDGLQAGDALTIRADAPA